MAGENRGHFGFEAATILIATTMPQSPPHMRS